MHAPKHFCQHIACFWEHRSQATEDSDMSATWFDTACTYRRMARGH
ncbi:hypothetical protein [Methylobacterium indicum]|nr:hypothetical protein [Methylobacterium indicum]